MGFEALAGLLGVMGYPECETWFQQTEEVVGFAPQKPSAKRPIILRRWQNGPTAVVFPRTSRLADSELRNPGHSHKSTWPKCWLHDEGSIVLSHPVVLNKDHLDEHHRLCAEEDLTTIDAVRAARW